jgi:hypothetical protein
VELAAGPGLAARRVQGWPRHAAPVAPQER